LCRELEAKGAELGVASKRKITRPIIAHPLCISIVLHSECLFSFTKIGPTPLHLLGTLTVKKRA
jgi:hypothetical protein